MNNEESKPMSPIEAQLSPTPAVASSKRPNKAVGSIDNVTQSKVVVIGVLFLVTGALGLPLLWVNKRFSTAERAFWTLLVLTYTLSLIWVTIEIVLWAYSRLMPV